MLPRQVFRNFWSRLAATPAGRRHIYSFAIAAEEGDEHGVFDLLADKASDIDLKKLVRAHQADEERHAGLFRECLSRMGATREAIPDSMQIIRRMGGKFNSYQNTDQTVVELYAMLRAIEVRGVEQFPIIAEALRPFDAFGADTFVEVAADEKRHVGFCDRIGSVEAKSSSEWQRAVQKYEKIERAAFLEHGIVSLRYAIRNGLLEPNLLENAGEKLITAMENLRDNFAFLPKMPVLNALRI
jgi:rubrerythrin